MLVFPKLSIEEQKEARAFANYSSTDFDSASDKEIFEFYATVKETQPDLLQSFRDVMKED